MTDESKDILQQQLLLVSMSNVIKVMNNHCKKALE